MHAGTHGPCTRMNRESKHACHQTKSLDNNMLTSYIYIYIYIPCEVYNFYGVYPIQLLEVK